MPAESEHFQCPMCGMHAPIERLEEGPFKLEKWLKVLGGKVKMEPEERRARGARVDGRGTASGRLAYTEEPVDDELLDSVKRRAEEITDVFVQPG